MCVGWRESDRKQANQKSKVNSFPPHAYQDKQIRVER
jgi:hypothetical protein